MEYRVFNDICRTMQASLRWGYECVPNATLVPFELHEYADSDFDRYGIPPPPELTNCVPKRKAEYLAGRRAALAALGRIGVAEVSIPIGPNRAPVWPADVLGSITHTSNIAAAIAIRKTTFIRGIGIDAEELIATEHVEGVRRSVLSMNECEALLPFVNETSEAYAATVAFSAKESFYKATSDAAGRIFGFNALRILSCDAKQGAMVAALTTTLASTLPYGRRFVIRWSDIGRGTVLSSCIW